MGLCHGGGPGGDTPGDEDLGNGQNARRSPPGIGIGIGIAIGIAIGIGTRLATPCTNLFLLITGYVHLHEKTGWHPVPPLSYTYHDRPGPTQPGSAYLNEKRSTCSAASLGIGTGIGRGIGTGRGIGIGIGIGTGIGTGLGIGTGIGTGIGWRGHAFFGVHGSITLLGGAGKARPLLAKTRESAELTLVRYSGPAL